MSSGLGRFNDRKTKQQFLQKKADAINEQKGYSDPKYYETFDNFNPIIVKKEIKPLIDESALIEKLPFEKDGPIEDTYGPLNIGLSKSHAVPSNTHARFKEIDQFYKTIKESKGGGRLFVTRQSAGDDFEGGKGKRQENESRNTQRSHR